VSSRTTGWAARRALRGGGGALTLAIGGWQMARHAIAGMGALGLGLVVTWAIIRGFSA